MTTEPSPEFSDTLRGAVESMGFHRRTTELKVSDAVDWRCSCGGEDFTEIKVAICWAYMCDQCMEIVLCAVKEG